MEDTGPVTCALPLLAAAGLTSAGVARSRNRATPTIKSFDYHPPATAYTQQLSYTSTFKSLADGLEQSNTGRDLYTADVPYAQPLTRPGQTLHRDKFGDVHTQRMVDPVDPRYDLPHYEEPRMDTPAIFHRSRTLKPSTLSCEDIEQSQPRVQAVPRGFRNSMDVSDINGTKRRFHGTSRSLECQDIVGTRKYFRQGGHMAATCLPELKSDGARWAKTLPARLSKGQEFGCVPRRSISTKFSEVPRKTVLQRPITYVEFSPGPNHIQNYL